LLFDCTPDVSHHEQSNQIIQYVGVSDGNISIKDSFIDFIHTHGKTGNGLASEILNKLAEDGTDIENARGQCYNNTANMAGKYNGVQAHILQKNVLAQFVPYATHSLNLAGVHAASVNNVAIAFSEMVQRFFTFFFKFHQPLGNVNEHITNVPQRSLRNNVIAQQAAFDSFIDLCVIYL
jgi:hypothetical protein